MKFSRRASTQDVSWFLDQARQKRIDLTPPYQRKSVWTSGDRRFFLDTIFRDYPCPPIYLHKTIDETGAAIYHVVDGKQRIETVINFANQSRLRLPNEFGDERLNNKRWKDIFQSTDLRNRFLNYVFSVEYFDDVDGTLVNEIFARMNKNSRKLTPQELRNARFDGWFAKQVESEVENTIWRTFSVVTPGKARRMADAQFIAELLMVIVQGKIVGFDHDTIDEVYADYDDIESPDSPFDVDRFQTLQSATRKTLVLMNEINGSVESHASTVSNMYTLWSFLVLNRDSLPSIQQLAERYDKFMSQVEGYGVLVKGAANPDSPMDLSGYSAEAIEYFQNNQSATTELPQRQSRLDTLQKALLN